MRILKTRLLTTVWAVAAFAAAGGTARDTLLSDLIAARQTLASGRLIFSNFAVTLANGVKTNAIDVTPAIDSAGNFGLTFTTSAIASTGGGDIIADITFDVAVAGPGMTIQAVHQSMAAIVSGAITAFSFSTVGQPGSPSVTSMSNCVDGSRSGCPQILTATDNATLVQPVASSPVERQIQLQAAKGTPSSGSVTSFGIAFSVVVEAPALQLSV